MARNIDTKGRRVLTAKETISALGGHLELADDGRAVTVLDGKWTPLNDGYFSVRLTGVAREYCETEMIPRLLLDKGVKEPERFNDSVVKNVNRHAVIIKAMQRNWLGPNKTEDSHSPAEDFHYMTDRTMHRDKRQIFSSIDALKVDGKLVQRKHYKSWIICIEPIILPDYKIPLCEGEEIWKGGKSPKKDHMDPGEYQNGNFDCLMFSEVWYVPKADLYLDVGEQPDLDKHFEMKTRYHNISFTSAGNNNEKYIDAESKVDNDILGYKSGFEEHHVYNSEEFSNEFIPGPRILF